MAKADKVHLEETMQAGTSLVFVFFLDLDGLFFYFFFFQAEDGIRDGHVTGVQTCALPIFHTVGGSWSSTRRICASRRATSWRKVALSIACSIARRSDVASRPALAR